MFCSKTFVYSSAIDEDYINFLLKERSSDIIKLLKNALTPDTRSAEKINFSALVQKSPRLALVFQVAFLLYHPLDGKKLHKVFIIEDGQRWINLEYILATFFYLSLANYDHFELAGIVEANLQLSELLLREVTNAYNLFGLILKDEPVADKDEDISYIFDSSSDSDDPAATVPPRDFAFVKIFKKLLDDAYKKYPVTFNKIALKEDLLACEKETILTKEPSVFLRLIAEEVPHVQYLVNYKSMFENYLVTRNLIIHLINEGRINMGDAENISIFYFWGLFIKSYAIAQASNELQTFKYYLKILRDVSMLNRFLVGLKKDIQDKPLQMRLQRSKTESNFYLIIYTLNNEQKRYVSYKSTRRRYGRAKIFPTDGVEWSALFTSST